MRDYAKISPQFWINQQGREIRKLGGYAQLIALYLISCPNASMIGIYYLPISFIAHETGVSLEEVSHILKHLCALGYCCYDFDMEYVWVINMADEQIGGQLKSGDNRIKNINEAYQALPELPFLPDFFERYASLFHLEAPRKGVHSKNTPTKNNEIPLQSPFEGEICTMLPPFERASKVLRSQEQEQKQEKEQEQEQKQKQEVARARHRGVFSPPLSEIEWVFEHWKAVLNHPNAMLDDKRRKLVKDALTLGYTTTQLCNAITGCSYTPHNMGDNERGQRYDGLNIILRDADQIERFIAHFHSPPCSANSADKLTQSNWAASQRWLAEKMKEKTDETV